MAHEWIFDVLNDMRTYADKNGLPALAAQITVALHVAKSEIAGSGRIAPRPGDDNPA